MPAALKDVPTKSIKVVFVIGYSNHLKIFNRIIKELYNFDGLSIKCVVVKVPEDLQKKLPFFENFLHKKPIMFARYLLKHEQPDIVVTGSDQGFFATLLKICRMNDVPTLAIQDGILMDKETRGKLFGLFSIYGYLPWRSLAMLSRVPIIEKVSVFLGWRVRSLAWGFGGIYRIAVMGEYSKRLLIKRGVHTNRIVVTGYPLFDNVVSEKKLFNRALTLQELKIKHCEKLVVLITQPFVEDKIWSPATRKLFISSVIKSVKKTSSTKLIIKIHPREDLAVYSSLIDDLGEADLILLKDFDVNKLLLASDCVLTVSSTVGMWALLYDKPLIVLNCFPTLYFNLYQKMVIVVNNLADLPAILIKILEQTNNMCMPSKSVLKDHVYLADGKCSRRIAFTILQMLNMKNMHHGNS